MTTMKTQNASLPYNFLIGGDGETYEIRGWSEQSGFTFLPQNSSLTIGIIGITYSVYAVDISITILIPRIQVHSISIHRQYLNSPRRVL